MLAFPDYKKPFILWTDASSLGVGAALMQASESQQPHVIAYASRVLNSAESKYSVTHLEALAVVWALKHFRDIIYGYPITVYTDHSAVTQLFSGKNLTFFLSSGQPSARTHCGPVSHMHLNLVTTRLYLNFLYLSLTSPCRMTFYVAL